MKKLSLSRSLNWMTPIMGGMLLACSSAVTIKASRAAPSFSAHNIRKVLVVSALKAPEFREPIESEFIQQWKEYHVAALASMDFVPPNRPLVKAHIDQIAKNQGCDSILIIRMQGFQEVNPKIAKPKGAPTPPPNDESSLSQNTPVIVASPEYGNVQVVEFTTNLFDATTRKKLWGATTRTILSGDTAKLAQDFAHIILKNLYKNQ